MHRFRVGDTNGTGAGSVYGRASSRLVDSSQVKEGIAQVVNECDICRNRRTLRRILKRDRNFCIGFAPDGTPNRAISSKGDSGTPITCNVGEQYFVAGFVQGGRYQNTPDRTRSIAVDVRKISGWIAHKTGVGREIRWRYFYRGNELFGAFLVGAVAAVALYYNH